MAPQVRVADILFEIADYVVNRDVRDRAVPRSRLARMLAQSLGGEANMWT